MLCHLLTKLELTASASMAQRLTDDCVCQWVNDFKNIYKHITIYRPKSSDSVVVLSLCSKSFSQIQIRNSYGKNCHYEVVKEYIFFIGIAASTFPHRNLSLSFVKLPSKKFLNLLGAFIMKL